MSGMSFRLQYVNSLWPSDAIWRQGTRSTLVQVMACCLTAPSHYLTNVDLSSLRSSDVHLMAISFEISQPSVTKISLKIIFLRFHWNLPGASELKCIHYTRLPPQHCQFPPNSHNRHLIARRIENICVSKCTHPLEFTPVESSLWNMIGIHRCCVTLMLGWLFGCMINMYVQLFVGDIDSDRNSCQCKFVTPVEIGSSCQRCVIIATVLLIHWIWILRFPWPDYGVDENFFILKSDRCNFIKWSHTV